MRVDLNADVGESFGVYEMGSDADLMRSITSASIACGFHAGDPSVMRRTVQLAARAGVNVGAHPGFPDLQGFGRREMKASPDDVFDFTLYQIGALYATAKSEGVPLRHVKPHGALYNSAVRDAAIAEAIVRAVAAFDPALLLMAPPDSELLTAGRRVGLRVAVEAFADRSYESDGTLTPRHVDGSVIDSPVLAAERAVRMMRAGEVTARDGAIVAIRPDTICVHGDTPDAGDLAAAVRHALEQAGVTVAPLSARA